MQLMRSTCPIHGREMTNRAFDTYASHPASKMMSDIGIWHLERTGDDAGQFYEKANWAESESAYGLLVLSYIGVIGRIKPGSCD